MISAIAASTSKQRSLISFLPALYGETLKDCTYRRNLSALPVKFAGLAFPDPTASSVGNYKASTLVCSHILAAFRGTKSFSSAEAPNSSALLTTSPFARRSLLKSRPAGLISRIRPCLLSSQTWTAILAEQFYMERKQGNG
jgi:hypothetical protein